MSQVNFAAMSLDEAKHYFLAHRDDQQAFHAYMDKLQASGRAIVIDPTNPESETAAIAQMQKRLGIQS
jgi:hypothetical protein